MLHRNPFTTLILFLCGAMLLGSAQAAYPVTATSGRTTVTGTYRPLNFDMSLVNDGTAELDYNAGDNLSFTGKFSGIFESAPDSGYSATGTSGVWQMSLFLTTDAGLFAFNDSGSEITITPGGIPRPIGTITYLGGLVVETGALTAGDTPVGGDVFGFYSTTTEDLLRVSCTPTTASCDDFTLEFLQPVTQLGPFVFSDLTGRLDTDRLNPECDVEKPCGNVTLRTTNIPEPATVLLVGIGMLGLALGRRRKA